jgi:hypothetical protein
MNTNTEMSMNRKTIAKIQVAQGKLENNIKIGPVKKSDTTGMLAYSAEEIVRAAASSSQEQADQQIVNAIARLVMYLETE